jgi:hypothetical protein
VARHAVYGGPIRAAATIALIGSISCSGGSTSPTPTSTAGGLAGTWSGTTFQGRSIAFTISPANQLTALTVGYEIDTCSGVASFTNLASPLFPVPGTTTMAFGHGGTLPDRSEVSVSVQGYSLPDNTVAGTVAVFGRPTCGTSESVAGLFHATRR